ncbi:hypothetical protein BDV09DRAFT_103869 [Aspergillus tetrazonus]
MTKRPSNDGHILATKCPDLEGAGLILYITFDKRPQQIASAVSSCCLSLRDSSRISETSVARKWCRSRCRLLLTFVQHDALAGIGAALLLCQIRDLASFRRGTRRRH